MLLCRSVVALRLIRFSFVLHKEKCPINVESVIHLSLDPNINCSHISANFNQSMSGLQNIDATASLLQIASHWFTNHWIYTVWKRGTISSLNYLLWSIYLNLLLFNLARKHFQNFNSIPKLEALVTCSWKESLTRHIECSNNFKERKKLKKWNYPRKVVFLLWFCYLTKRQITLL